jgi:hypothetical protein
MNGEEQERDAKLEARTIEVVELTDKTAEEAEQALASFWATIRQVRERLANAGVMGPEQLDRQR